MFSNKFKNKIIQKYNISESTINRPIHFRVPELININRTQNQVYNTLKKLNNPKENQVNKITTLSPLTKFKKEIKIFPQKTHKFNKKKLEILLNDENPINDEIYKDYNKSIKMIYEIKKFPNIESKSVIKDIVNKKNHKKSTLFPRVIQNIKKAQKLSKLSKMPIKYFFTPQLTKIKIKNRNNMRNLMEFPLKEKNIIINNNNIEKEIAKQEQSIDYDKCSIRIIKTNNNNNNLLKYKGNNNLNYKSYSYDYSPIRSIKSRYYSNNSNTNDN